MDAAEYKHVVLGLIFVKYISDTFQTRSNELTERFADPEDEYYIQDADSAGLVSELEDRDYYREVNVFWVPEGQTCRPVLHPCQYRKNLGCRTCPASRTGL
jgi:type I restriction enzyme M protein